MEILSDIPLIGGSLGIVLPFLAVLGIVVAVHEFGHYIVGRWCGIHAEVFSIGFGPKLFGWTDRRGTRWQVAALPLGGFVKFAGDMDPASAGRLPDDELTPEERKRAFHNASLWRRALTVAAGPFFNFALSVLIFAGVGYGVGQVSNAPVIGGLSDEVARQTELRPGDRVVAIGEQPIQDFGEMIRGIMRANGEEVPITVVRDGRELTFPISYRISATAEFVVPGNPASRAGLAAGDRILTVDGIPVGSFYDLQVAAADRPLDEPITLEVERDGRMLFFDVMPEPVERAHPVTGEVKPIPTLGIRAVATGGIEPSLIPVSLGYAIEGGVMQTYGIIAATLNYVGDLIFADADTSQLGGPIRIAQISGEKAEEGTMSFLMLIAIISTSIGLINLFPIPVLDGGHLMFYLFEALRGRPAGESAIRYGHMVGISLVLLLMVFATVNDLLRL